MPELPVKHAPLAGLGAVAAVLALLAGIGGWAGALAGTLAQPLFALAARHWRTRQPLALERLRRNLKH